MTSQIDPTVPVFGTPTTQSVRNNFQTAANEISALQSKTVDAPFLPVAGGRMGGAMWLFNDPTDAMHPVTLGYAQVNFGAPGGSPAVPEAPVDTKYYARINGAWQPVLPITAGTSYPLTGELILPGNPVDALGAVPKQYVDVVANAAIPHEPQDNGNYGRHMGAWVPVLPLAGGTLTGALILPGNAATALAAVPLQQLQTYVPLAGAVTLTGGLGVGGQAVPSQQNNVLAAPALYVPLGSGIQFNWANNLAVASGRTATIGLSNNVGLAINVNGPASGGTSSSGSALGISSEGTFNLVAGVNAPGNILTLDLSGQGANAGTLIPLAGTSQLYSDGNYFAIGLSGPWNAGTSWRIDWLRNTGELIYYSGSSGAELLYLDGGGNMHIAGTLTQGSDARSKENIAAAADGLEVIARLSPKRFNRLPAILPDGSEAPRGRRELGFVAQDIEDVLPEAVVTNDRDGMLSLDHAPVIAVLVNAVKELAARVEGLEGKRRR